jgi:hypothetical protein
MDAVLDRRAERRLDRLLDLGELERVDVVLELLELHDPVGREQVGARRGDLTELHERGPEIHAHAAHALGQRDAVPRLLAALHLERDDLARGSVVLDGAVR